jgi:hypothetical protein
MSYASTNNFGYFSRKRKSVFVIKEVRTSETTNELQYGRILCATSALFVHARNVTCDVVKANAEVAGLFRATVITMSMSRAFEQNLSYFHSVHHPSKCTFDSMVIAEFRLYWTLLKP